MQYDIIVIGGGPGGYVAAIKAAQQNKRVCLIESTWIGGTCLNEGCIPTKTLMRSVEVLECAKDAAKFAVLGVETNKVQLSIDGMQKRKTQVVTQLQTGIQTLLKKNKVTVKIGLASFLDRNTVQVNGEKLTSEYFIIATGSSASIPNFISCSEDAKVITSRELLNLDEIPASMVIIGGGVVGIEFAYLFDKLGTKVTVIEALDEILPVVDADIAALARKRLSRDGVEIVTGAKVSAINRSDVLFEAGDEKRSVSGEYVLVAIGRAANTAGLDIEKAGVAAERGAIITNEKLQTNIPNIYAIGDVNGKLMLAHVASSEGCIAVSNICGIAAAMDYAHIPSCIYTIPEIACVGLTEMDAKDSCSSVKVGKFPMAANSKSLIEGEQDGLVKVIINGNTGEILGVHIYGLHATEMIGGIAALMTSEATLDELLASVFPHPSASEAIAEAFMGVAGKAIHI